MAAYAYQIFKENYNWSKPIRSVGVRGADIHRNSRQKACKDALAVVKYDNLMRLISAIARDNQNTMGVEDENLRRCICKV